MGTRIQDNDESDEDQILHMRSPSMAVMLRRGRIKGRQGKSGARIKNA
jgi:hypothetical protein